MSAPKFVTLDGATLLAQNIAAYEAISGKTLQPGQAETLLINTFTDIMLRTLWQIQSACEQMLVNYSTAPALDELGKLVGVTRLSASGSLATVQFNLVSGHGGLVIPSGLRVQTTDGKAVFAVIQNTTVDPGDNTASVECICQTAGVIGNNYAPGTISVILDPQPYVSSAANTNTSSGGADTESDVELRSRIILAPAAYSTAGSTDSYKFHAKSASPAIIDVAVKRTSPGVVGVYPLVAGGVTPPEIISLVESALNQDKVIPVTDTVEVEAPTVVNYNIEVEVEIYEDADASEIQDNIEASLQAYADGKAVVMGLDIIVAHIIAKAASVEGVYNVSVISPSADMVVAFNEVPIMGTLTVTVTGENEG